MKLDSAIIRIPTGPLSLEEWREYRKQGIGGSDAAAIVGLNRYSSLYTVWADKTGRLPQTEENEAMRLGRYLEPYIADRFEEETGKKVRRNNAILKNPAYPYALANIDREIIGENAGLECKSTSELNLKRFRGGEYPGNYYVQCVHYMAVTGTDRWYLAVLIGNKVFKWFVVERDEDEIAALMSAEKAFWDEYVEKDIAPPVDGTQATEYALKAIYTESICNEDVPVDLFGYDNDIKDYLHYRGLAKEYEAMADLRAQRLKAELGRYETGICDQYKITWKSQVSRRFDWARYQQDNPDKDISQYFNETKSRRFMVKEA